METYQKIACAMYAVEDYLDVPRHVRQHLDEVAMLTSRAGGELRSRQVVAAVIAICQEASKY